MKAVRDDEASDLSDLYRGSGIQELCCCATAYDWTPYKLAVYF